LQTSFTATRTYILLDHTMLPATRQRWHFRFYRCTLKLVFNLDSEGFMAAVNMVTGVNYNTAE